MLGALIPYVIGEGKHARRWRYNMFPDPHGEPSKSKITLFLM